MTYSAHRQGYKRHSAQAYANVGLETEVLSASPEHLITLLYNGARAAIMQAKLHLQQGNIAQRGMAISKAIDIVDSGLKASVSVEEGGELATNLIATYEIIIHNLLRANMQADVIKLDLAEQLLSELSQAWTTAVDTQRA
ncbi:flagellar export chaperone FliS [Paenalcaligenes niemegkensis]|uniref:flagellar export chaperone FliS n=1 Tax=Paenalcaligenes niemegkensis TaxID=2895469 RepID=UPI001EE840D1|nr:flagellar export chaperone FliS [Paenalcaligenes niemegkensis]MCQ9616015.1 flagellar export chaperone FliS [Paenalcaligenes niemegkensis]